MFSEKELDKRLSTPSKKLIDDMKDIKGDIMVLGAGGKMGPTLCLLAKNAIKKAGVEKKVIAVSRFTDPTAKQFFHDNDIETIPTDLLDQDQVSALPEVENVIFMAGKKFGTSGNEYLTWAMNAKVPVLVAEKFKKSNIVVFSSGNIYPMVPIHSGGVTEKIKPVPVGEYAQSVLARERMFEYAAQEYGTNVFMYRLNYAVDLRYGVLYDIASSIMEDEPISITTPSFNCIWQGDANEIAIRALLHADSPAVKMNVTGPETVSVRKAANQMGQLLGKEVKFKGEESNQAYLSDSGKAFEEFGYPTVSLNTLIKWQVKWIEKGGRALGKPTHFEEREGDF